MVPLGMATRAEFRLHILKLSWADLGYRYTTEDVWPALAKTSLADPVFLIEESDIRLYDWEHQEIWLTPPAIERLRGAEGETLRVPPSVAPSLPRSAPNASMVAFSTTRVAPRRSDSP